MKILIFSPFLACLSVLFASAYGQNETVDNSSDTMPENMVVYVPNESDNFTASLVTPLNAKQANATQANISAASYPPPHVDRIVLWDKFLDEISDSVPINKTPVRFRIDLSLPPNSIENVLMATTITSFDVNKLYGEPHWNSWWLSLDI